MTHTAKHTPGPWKAVPDRSRNLYTWYVEGAKGVVPAIARLSLIDACEEIEGNAHLIAAAPAMYEALVKTMKVLRSLRDSKEEWYTLVTPELLTAWDMNKAALSQAEGRDK